MVERTVKEVKVYEEKGLQFLSIRYLVEDDTSIKEFHFPKVRFPIEYADLNIDHDYGLLGSTTRYDAVNLVLPTEELAYKPVTQHFMSMAAPRDIKKLSTHAKSFQKKQRK